MRRKYFNCASQDFATHIINPITKLQHFKDSGFLSCDTSIHWLGLGMRLVGKKIKYLSGLQPPIWFHTLNVQKHIKSTDPSLCTGWRTGHHIIVVINVLWWDSKSKNCELVPQLRMQWMKSRVHSVFKWDEATVVDSGKVGWTCTFVAQWYRLWDNFENLCTQSTSHWPVW